jgi:hypothetical protein
MKKCYNGHELPARFVFVSPHVESARTCWEFMNIICSNDGKHLGQVTYETGKCAPI